MITQRHSVGSRGEEAPGEDLDAHPLAENYPLLEGEQYEAFKADIAANGCHNPIWLYRGQILDGRNRYRACRELGIEPTFAEYDGDDLAGFVISQNEHRRHLDHERRRESVRRLRAQGKSLRAIADEVGVDQKQVQRDLRTVSPPDKVTRRDGKQYPARLPHVLGDREPVRAEATPDPTATARAAIAALVADADNDGPARKAIVRAATRFGLDPTAVLAVITAAGSMLVGLEPRQATIAPWEREAAA